MKIQEQVLLGAYTTFQIGGPARWFAEATTEQEILEALSFARERKLPVFILGGGSNLLVSDEGYSGLVLHIALKGIQLRDESDFRVCLSAAAGEEWDAVVTRAVGLGLSGIECLAGIPGTVGGTPVQNVGAYGQEVAETVLAVRAYDLELEKFVEIAAADCGFTYRCSLFNTHAKGRYIVTRVDYALTKNGQPAIRYADLRKAFSPEALPTLDEVTEKVRSIRLSKGMLLVDGDPDCCSAGSFFKNPIVSEEQYRHLVEARGSDLLHYAAGPGPDGVGQVKLAAAWLIEQAGFTRGFQQGRAAISTRHTLALVNSGGATATEILALAEKIAGTVYEQFKIKLELEPVLLRL